MMVWHLNVEAIAVQRAAVKLHDSSLRLVFHHHVLKQNRTENNLCYATIKSNACLTASADQGHQGILP